MHNSLSVRDQNIFISTYKNLLNNKKNKQINKNNVKTLQKILNKCDKVEICQLLMTKMESCPKDPAALENTFSKLFNKLEAQNSSMCEKKEDKLKNIHNTKISGQIKALDDNVHLLSRSISAEKNEIAKLQETITKADVQIKKLQSKIKPLEATLSNISQEEFSAKKDVKRLKKD